MVPGLAIEEAIEFAALGASALFPAETFSQTVAR
jgi:hypothetical protein